MSTIKTLISLSHELVHVKQFYFREFLVDFENNRAVWKGKVYKVDFSSERFNNYEYWDCPWEIEAHGLEKGLIQQWMDDKGYTGKEDWYKMVF